MRNDPWQYGGQPMCLACEFIEPGTAMMRKFKDQDICDVCWDELVKCGVCGEERVTIDEQICDDCRGQSYED